jgi:twitching motility protein PilI
MAETQTPLTPAASRRARNRTLLREFQAGLAERLALARTTPSTQSRLALRIAHGDAQKNYLIDLPEAGEIIAIPEVTSVPLTKPWYRGLANVRGGLVSVIDLGVYQNGVATNLDKDSRVLAFSPELKFNAGILVTRMLGLRGTGQLTERTDRSEEELAANPHWIGRSFIDQDGVTWEELSLAALAADDRFLQIGIR